MNTERTTTWRGKPRDPAGSGNTKTAAWGTYRPVGPTCASRCPYLGNGCYAEGGHVAMAAKRASATDAHRAVRAVHYALSMSRAEGRRMVRLHVSGDWGRPGVAGQTAIDRPYVRAVARLARMFGGSASRPVAWCYTHFSRSTMERSGLASLLRASGVALRYSDDGGAWGAIVLPVAEDSPDFSRMARARGATACPAQLGTNVTCASCRLCWSRERPVAFAAHGASSKKARASALKVLSHV